MSWSVVTWTHDAVSLFILAKKNQTCQESKMGRIMNHYIFIQLKSAQELFVEEYNWFVCEVND